MSALLTKLRARQAGNREGGFTLVELLVVVVIIGVLIAIAIPVYLNYTRGAKDKSAQSDVRNAISTLETCNVEYSTYPKDVPPTGGTPGGCDGQTINVSDDTSLTYTTADPAVSYVLVGTNSGGRGISYCYNSEKGGSVTEGTTC